MKPLRMRIQEAARQNSVPQTTVEKDYALSYLLAGIASQPALRDTLVFKGGTALKKLFFGDYRFSEHLDFSAQDAPRGTDLEHAVGDALNQAAKLLSAQGPFSLAMERYVGRQAHPHGQEAFTTRVRFPWHPGPLCTVKAEITHAEPVLLPPEKRPLIHGYDEELVAELRC